MFIDVQVARGLLATGNPEQLRGQSLDRSLARSRLAPLRVSEMRDTSQARPDQADDAAVWANLGIGSVLLIGYSSRDVRRAYLGIAGAQPRDNWEVQLHLLMKLVGSSLGDRTRAHRDPGAICDDLEERNELALLQRQRRPVGFRYAEQPGLSVAALEDDAGLR